MGTVKQGTGPWGDAIRYWLPRRNMNAADLARATGIEEKTISSMRRGFHTTTRKLEAVAKAFEVPLDQVLVSPDRQKAIDDQKRVISEAVELALQHQHERLTRGSTDATLNVAIDAMVRETEAKADRDEAAAIKRRKKLPPAPTFKKANRRAR